MKKKSPPAASCTAARRRDSAARHADNLMPAVISCAYWPLVRPTIFVAPCRVINFASSESNFFQFPVNQRRAVAHPQNHPAVHNVLRAAAPMGVVAKAAADLLAQLLDKAHNRTPDQSRVSLHAFVVQPKIFRRPGDGRPGFFGNQPQFRLRLRHRRFHLQPAARCSLLRKKRPHWRRGKIIGKQPGGIKHRRPPISPRFFGAKNHPPQGRRHP